MLSIWPNTGANITNLGDALWWSVITITTVGYGDYTPISPIGRLIGVIVMFSGIGIAVTLVTVFSQDRVQRMQERLKSKTDGKARILANETKAAIKDKIEGIEKLTEEDFDGLLIMRKVCVLLYLKSLKIFTIAQDVATNTAVSLNFAAVVVLLLLSLFGARLYKYEKVLLSIRTG